MVRSSASLLCLSGVYLLILWKKLVTLARPYHRSKFHHNQAFLSVRRSILFVFADKMPPSLSLLKTSFNLKPSIFDDLKGAQNDHKTSILIDELVLNEKITEVVSKDSREHPWANSNEDSSKKSSSLRKGPVGFMVLSVRNTAAPKVSPENNFAPRMLKVSVSDGYHTYHLIEVEPIKLLSVDTAPGTKIILTGDLTVRNNLVLIKAANVQFVGGRVEEMYEKWVVTKDFNTKAIRDTGAPKFVPFGRAIDNVKIDKQGKGDTKEEESAEKTETDAKFGAVRDQNLEAVKQLKTEQKGLTSGATAQLPSSDFFHSKKKEPQNGATSSGTTVTMGNTPAPDPFADDPFGGPRGGRGGRGGRRGRKGSDAEYDEGPDDAKFKAPSQQASLFDIIQNKIDDMTVQDIEFSDPNPRPMAPVSTRLGPSSVRNGDTRSVTYERDGQRAGRGYRNERNFNEGSYGGDRGPNGQRVSQRGRGRGNFEDQRTRGDRNSNNGYDRNYNQGGQNVQRNQYQHVDGLVELIIFIRLF